MPASEALTKVVYKLETWGHEVSTVDGNDIAVIFSIKSCISSSNPPTLEQLEEELSCLSELNEDFKKLLGTIEGASTPDDAFSKTQSIYAHDPASLRTLTERTEEIVLLLTSHMLISGISNSSAYEKDGSESEDDQHPDTMVCTP